MRASEAKQKHQRETTVLAQFLNSWVPPSPPHPSPIASHLCVPLECVDAPEIRENTGYHCAETPLNRAAWSLGFGAVPSTITMKRNREVFRLLKLSFKYVKHTCTFSYIFRVWMGHTCLPRAAPRLLPSQLEDQTTHVSSSWVGLQRPGSAQPTASQPCGVSQHLLEHRLLGLTPEVWRRDRGSTKRGNPGLLLFSVVGIVHGGCVPTEFA